MLTILLQIILVGGAIYFGIGASVLMYQLFSEMKGE
jgi:hypothetical protein